MSLTLARTVRLLIPLASASASADELADTAKHNAFAAWPPPIGCGAFVELEATLGGEPDAESGYLIGIQEVDSAVRAAALAVLPPAFRSGEHREPAGLLRTLAERIAASLPHPLVSLRWSITPRHAFIWSPDMPDEVLYRERFEFSAAHRLHVASRDDEWNRAFYGKCNNPAGHGHNYELEVAVVSTLDDAGAPTPDPREIASIVDETVIDRWDHKHLNADVEDFRDRVPSVEHIALRARDLLAPILADAGGRLDSLTVWETGKTSCTVR